MHEMRVDVEHRRPVRLLDHDVGVPDLVEERPHAGTPAPDATARSTLLRLSIIRLSACT